MRVAGLLSNRVGFPIGTILDSILKVIEVAIKRRAETEKIITPMKTGMEPVRFVEQGQKAKKKKKEKTGILDTASDGKAW